VQYNSDLNDFFIKNVESSEVYHCLAVLHLRALSRDGTIQGWPWQLRL